MSFIETYANGPDFELFKSIVNQGIDARLEAFTQSTFYEDGHRFHFDFHVNELSILLRRLTELADNGNDDADSWLDSILYVQYDIETI